MKKNVAIALLISFAVLGGIYLYFHEGIQRGLSFPGKVGTAADHYFHDGTKLEPDISYGEFILRDGSVWRYVAADTEGQSSYPTWYIIIAQGPERQTYIMQSNHQIERPIIDWLDYFRSQIPQTHTSADVEQTLIENGFRKTSY